MCEKRSEGIQLDELSCVVCQETYGEGEFTPRLLSCGHSFCTRCLGILIKTRNFCPDCRTPITAKDVSSIPVIYIVKKIINSLDELNRAMSSNEMSCPIALDCNISDKFSEVSLTDTYCKFPSVGTCLNHSAPQQFWCDSCQKWICGTCIYVDHGQTNSTPCRILLASSQFMKLKEKELLKIVQQEFALESARQTLSSLYGLIRRDFVSQATKEGHSHSSCNHYEPLLKIISEKLDDLKKAHERMDDVRQKMNVDSLKQLKYTSKLLENIWGGKNFPQTSEELSNGIWTQIIEKVPEALIRATDLTASLLRDGKQYISSMYVKNGYLVIPSLGLSVSPGLFVVPFRELKSTQPDLRTFLQLYHHKKLIGTLQIKVHNNLWGEHFTTLCTGEKGPSYKGTKFFQSGGLFTKFLAGGDYEFNTGQGGKKLTELVDICEGIMEDGIICGHKSFSENTLAQFKIFYEVGSSPFANNPIGMVEFGLDLVRKISKGLYKDVIVGECGILLPLTKEAGSYCDI